MECIYFKSDHIVLHSHNSIFVLVFACFFAFLFSFQFLNTRVTAKLQKETVPTERRVIDLCETDKGTPLSQAGESSSGSSSSKFIKNKKTFKEQRKCPDLVQAEYIIILFIFFGLSTYADSKVFLDFFAAISSDFHYTIP